MEENKASKLSILTKGLVKENPTLVLLLGTCPFLATSTSAINGLGMGLSTTAVLICSNIVISILKNVIPDRVRIPCYITVIAGFVTIVQFLLQAYLPSLNASLGLYIPLIVVNCIILGRAEMFASKNKVFDSALDGIGMGLGFTLALFIMGMIREFIGAGTFLGMQVFPGDFAMIILALPPGGFFVFGILTAIVNKLTNGKLPNEFSCAGCPGDIPADAADTAGAAVAGNAAAALPQETQAPMENLAADAAKAAAKPEKAEVEQKKAEAEPQKAEAKAENTSAESSDAPDAVLNKLMNAGADAAEKIRKTGAKAPERGDK